MGELRFTNRLGLLARVALGLALILPRHALGTEYGSYYFNPSANPASQPRPSAATAQPAPTPTPTPTPTPSKSNTPFSPPPMGGNGDKGNGEDGDQADSDSKEKKNDNASKQAFHNEDIKKNGDAAGAELVGNKFMGDLGASQVSAAGAGVGAGAPVSGSAGAAPAGGGGGSSFFPVGVGNNATAGKVTNQVDPNQQAGVSSGAGVGGAGSGDGSGSLTSGGKTQEQLQRDAAYVARVASEAQQRRAAYNLQSALQNLARQQQHMSNIGKFTSQAAGDQQKQAQLGQAIGEQQRAGAGMMVQAVFHAASAVSQLAAAKNDQSTAKVATQNAAALSARTSNAAPVFATFSGPPANHGGAGSAVEKTLAAGSSLNFGGGSGSGGSGSGSSGSSSELGSGTGSIVTKAAATAGAMTSQDDPSRKPAAATAPKIYFGVYTPAPVEQVAAPRPADPDYMGPLARFLPADPAPGTDADAVAKGDDADILQAADGPGSKRRSAAFPSASRE